MRFGQQQMSQPGPWAFLIAEGLWASHRKKQEVSEVGKLAGIKIKYEFICFPDSKVLLVNIDVSNSLI